MNQHSQNRNLGPHGPRREITQILRQAAGGRREAVDQLTPLVYRELHAIAQSFLRHERRDHTLQATALVNEAYLRLVDQTRVEWKDRAHFLAVAGKAMRRILVDHARARQTQKRGEGWGRVTVTGLGTEREDAFDLIALEDALEQLAEKSPRKAQVVEMRYFAGLTLEEIAEVFDVSLSTVNRDWRYAQVELYLLLGGEPSDDTSTETTGQPE